MQDNLGEPIGTWTSVNLVSVALETYQVTTLQVGTLRSKSTRQGVVGSVSQDIECQSYNVYEKPFPTFKILLLATTEPMSMHGLHNPSKQKNGMGKEKGMGMAYGTAEISRRLRLLDQSYQILGKALP
ncbi:hypothetical protein N7456_008398 [Penicillium angulare]|uniref:Uncharacterized protein n=1 Tax=Penicillium angulare TaxID=116970 RepID=A0A9W9FCL1_9EURO|nr:hypothetical protein N7456_008398 [Penicillium angulare]